MSLTLFASISRSILFMTKLGLGQAVLGCVPRSKASPGCSHKPSGHTPKLGWHCAKLALGMCPVALDTQYVNGKKKTSKAFQVFKKNLNPLAHHSPIKNNIIPQSKINIIPQSKINIIPQAKISWVLAGQTRGKRFLQETIINGKNISNKSFSTVTHATEWHKKQCYSDCSWKKQLGSRTCLKTYETFGVKPAFSFGAWKNNSQGLEVQLPGHRHPFWKLVLQFMPPFWYLAHHFQENLLKRENKIGGYVESITRRCSRIWEKPSTFPIEVSRIDYVVHVLWAKSQRWQVLWQTYPFNECLKGPKHFFKSYYKTFISKYHMYICQITSRNNEMTYLMKIDMRIRTLCFIINFETLLGPLRHSLKGYVCHGTCQHGDLAKNTCTTSIIKFVDFIRTQNIFYSLIQVIRRLCVSHNWQSFAKDRYQAQNLSYTSCGMNWSANFQNRCPLGPGSWTSNPWESFPHAPFFFTTILRLRASQVS
ncbi:uncharacterized protein VP01_634g2 [Puccinia sorghi]|uniref:Uncharacterized protein n=1 Tax=Puccinia sorghi TaxID=27349 RepID=A0A0L6UG28_9BASI|nr:uncharacterized protein VP01_634g2 [Puccinia sorghi]